MTCRVSSSSDRGEAAAVAGRGEKSRWRIFPPSRACAAGMLSWVSTRSSTKISPRCAATSSARPGDLGQGLRRDRGLPAGATAQSSSMCATIRDYVLVTPQLELGRGRRSIVSPRPWYQDLYVDQADGILKRTDQLRELKKRRVAVAARRRSPKSIDRVPLAADRELRRVDGIWFEVTLAPLPEPEYRAVRVTERLPLSPWDPTGPTFEADRTTRRLVTPGCFDVVSGEGVLAGPETVDARSWEDYRKRQPDRHYAVAKRQLSSTALRRHGLTNLVEPQGEPASRSRAKDLTLWLCLLGF